MHVLTQKLGDTIILEPDIAIRILGVHDCYVRLGVVAPDTVTVRVQESEKKPYVTH